ncbi:MAG: hypothetical protein LBC92_04820 [Rickettsiales bacterium]|jgi:hypothetical protein|nr:hypothetical protein [Rickettsiales bacterium]
MNNDKILLIAGLVILSLILSIIIIRTFLYFFLLSIDVVSKPFKKQDAKKYDKEEDELLRDKKKEKSKENLHHRQDDFQVEEREPERIVGIAKPVGFWTSFIIGKNLTSLMQQKGLWTERIKSKERQRQMEKERNLGM